MSLRSATAVSVQEALNHVKVKERWCTQRRLPSVDLKETSYVPRCFDVTDFTRVCPIDAFTHTPVLVLSTRGCGEDHVAAEDRDTKRKCA